MSDLYGNQNPASFAWSSTAESNRTHGTRFQVTVAGSITRVGFYRGGTGTTFTWLGLYDGSGTLLWSATSPVDSGTVGWQWTPVSPAIAASPGVTYTAAGALNGVVFLPGNGTPATRAYPPAPFLFDDVPSHTGSGYPTYPTTANNGAYRALSATWEAIPSPVPGPGEGDPALTGDLNSWLSSDPAVQTHESDGLPWQTKQVVDAVGGVIGDLADAASATGSLMARTAELLGRTATILARLPADILTAIRTAADATLSWFGGGSLPVGAPTVPDRLDELAGRMLDLQLQIAAGDAVVNALWHRTETSNWLDAVPGGDWVLADTLEWDGPVGWNQSADCYVFRITSWLPTWSQEEIGGHLRFPHAAWWMALTDTLPHSRQSADMDVQILHQLPMRCSGILLRPREGFAGTLEAWLRPELGP